MCWHPTAENILASGGHDGLVVVWNLETGDPLYQIDIGDHPNGMCWNEDGSLLGVTCKDKKLKLIDPRKGEIIAVSGCLSFEDLKPKKLKGNHRCNRLIKKFIMLKYVSICFLFFF